MQSLIAMDIEAGKRIIVVDAGGGTIDILSTQVISTNPVLLHVTSPPSGGLWGGVAVNQRFLEFFNELFPEISDRALDERIMHGIVKAFEEGKKKSECVIEAGYAFTTPSTVAASNSHARLEELRHHFHWEGRRRFCEAKKCLDHRSGCVLAGYAYKITRV